MLLVIQWCLCPVLGADAPEVLGVKGRVEVLRQGSVEWVPIRVGERLNPRDRLRTGDRSEAILLGPNALHSTVRERTEIGTDQRDELPIIEVFRRMIHFFHRGPPGRLEIRGGVASAAVLGTEFTFELAPDGTAMISLYDGTVALTNDVGFVKLNSGEIGRATPGQIPRRETAVWMPNDFTRIQWALYYPAILDLGELGWADPPDPALRDCVAAYRAGNLPRALDLYPPDRRPATPPEKVFLAALVLSVGNVDEAEDLLGGIPDDPRLRRLAAAHRQLIAAVLRRDVGSIEVGPDRLGAELLAASYALQSQARLDEALDAARRATEVGPESGFAWVRRAELEFSFGRTRPAVTMVERALALTPEHAAAHALRGFLHAADNRLDAAEAAFERAIRLDPGLGNAWLGRGLCRIRRGNLAEGRQDLGVAAASEPQRSLLRSYLAKAFADERLFVTHSLGSLARHELDLARQLDPRDPTPWLYQSILDREENRLNDAIRGLDRAQDRVGERGLYRSEPLLDQDRAVASVNQAVAFRDAGMPVVGLQAAQRAVALDYANPAAHQFLAESYANAQQVNLRDETPRLGEYLVANLVAPVGAGLLSPALSQQEYSKLFERDGLGAFSRTTYLSRGAWEQTGGALGTFGRSSVLAEGFYQTDPGYVPNNDYEQSGFSVQGKQQIGPRDTLYAQTFYSDLDTGDLALRYDPNDADPDFRAHERLAPAVLAGWHRAWSPEHHTLALAGWIENDLSAENLEPTAFFGSLQTRDRSDFDLVSTELQHVWSPEDHAVIVGVRWQAGTFDVENQGVWVADGSLAYQQSVQPDFERFQAYAYDTWQVLEPLHLTVGLSYDDVLYPRNHRYGWLDEGEDRRTQVSPKAGLVWEIVPRTWLRAAYTRSLGGVSYDSSVRLEPTQVAGFNQAFRSLMPESVTGPSSAPSFETLGVALETRLTTNTWLSISGERLGSEVKRWWGRAPEPFLPAAQFPQELDYDEQALRVTLNRLLGAGWSLGASYRLGETVLDNLDPSLIRLPPGTLDEERAVLQTLLLSAYFNHPSGFFAAAEAQWMHQDDSGTRDEFVRKSWERSDDFWQFNLWGGWRFLRRRAEILVGVLNLTDQDYRLDPLSLTTAPERERTFIGRLSLSF